MKRASGLVRIPVVVALLVVAAGGAVSVNSPVTSENNAAPIAALPSSAQPSRDGEVAFLGEITVSASRIRG